MKLHPARILPICVAILLLGAATLCAGEPATLLLKDGRELTGTVEDLSNKVVIFLSNDGRLEEVPLTELERLEFNAELPVAAEQSESEPADEKREETETEVEAVEASHVEGDEPDEAEEGKDETEDGEPDESTDEPVIEPTPEPAPEETSPLKDDPLLGIVEPVIGGICGRFSEQCECALEGVAMWTQRLELGLRFRDGNSEEDFLDVRSKLERKDETRMFSLDLGGQYAKANGVPNANRWYGNSTIDLNREGNWIVFMTTRNEFDEFENLDYRGTAAGGLGYRFYNESDRRLIFRLGPGVTYQKFHDPRKVRTTPDLFGEVEFRWPIFDRTQLEHKTTVTPNVEDFQVFRMQSNYGIVVQLDERERWSLKFGLQHDYNSRPNPKTQPSDYMTGVRLVYQLK